MFFIYLSIWFENILIFNHVVLTSAVVDRWPPKQGWVFPTACMTGNESLASALVNPMQWIVLDYPHLSILYIILHYNYICICIIDIYIHIDIYIYDIYIYDMIWYIYICDIYIYVIYLYMYYIYIKLNCKTQLPHGSHNSPMDAPRLQQVLARAAEIQVPGKPFEICRGDLSLQ